MNANTILSFLLGLCLTVGAGVLVLSLPGCGDNDADATAPVDQVPAERVEAKVPGVTYGAHLEPEGLHGYIRWSEHVGQGAQPEGEAAFKNLRALGYRTILTVDGAVPEVELAKKYGLRYVHVPIGYDGITKEQALRIVKTIRSTPDPVFVHCHHGVHRGPAAAQLCRMSVDGISNEEGIAGLKMSGTSAKYTGLWRDVGAFQMPTEAELAAVSADLPSAVVPEGLRATMVTTSHRWTNLQEAKKERWEVSKEHPDVSPPHEARMLWELFREMARNDPEAQAQGDVFLAYLNESEKELVGLEEAIRAKDVAKADERFQAVKQLCNDCHRDYRNEHPAK
jgi:protein tyrosine phosphatase (PTP) superfamily phosphohydrolase (DUF442 family)